MLYSPGCWHEACTDPLTAAQTSQRWKPQRTSDRCVIYAHTTHLLQTASFISILGFTWHTWFSDLLWSVPVLTVPLCSALLTWTFISALVSVIIVCHVTSPPAALFPLVIMISLTVVKLELPVNLPVAIFKRLHYNTHNAIHSTSVIPVLGANCNSSLFLLPGPQCWLNPGCDALKALMQSTEQFL